MATEIVCAIIATAGVVISAALSAIISLKVSRNEIKMQKLSWNRDDALSFDDDFKRMCTCVMNYLEHPDEMYRTIALRQVLMLQASAPKSMQSALSELHQKIDAGDTVSVEKTLHQLISIKSRA